MSTFQLARNLAEWSQSFSTEERQSINFTCDDILPVAGTHRKILTHALENCKPISNDIGLPRQEEGKEEDQKSHLKIHQLDRITSDKDDLLSHLQLLDAQISDCEDKHTEEALRADQFYGLLDEQVNIAQFTNSLITKITSYLIAPPLISTLDEIAQQTTSYATGCDAVTENPSNDVVKEDTVGSTCSFTCTQDSIIENYLSILSDIEKTIATREGLHPGSKLLHSERADMTWTNTQLLQRLDLQATEKESLLKCISQEEAEVNRLKSQFPVLGSVSGRNNRVENMATAIEELILSTESLRQAIALKSQQNADHEDQVKMDLHEIYQQIAPLHLLSSSPSSFSSSPPLSSLQSALQTVQDQCTPLPASWQFRNELLRDIPGWKLHKVPEHHPLPLSEAPNSNGSDDDNDNKNDSETGENGNLYGLEHLVSTTNRGDEVFYCDSMEKRSRDFRSQFRSVTTAAGISPALALSDTLQCLSAVQKIGEDKKLSHSTPTTTLRQGENTEQRTTYFDQLLSEVKGISEQASRVNSLWAAERDSESVPSTVILLQKALREREQYIAEINEISKKLDEKFENLSDREHVLCWALRDKHDGYMAATCLVEALSLSLSAATVTATAAAAAPHGIDKGQFGGSGRLSSMSLKDMINELRESNGVPILE